MKIGAVFPTCEIGDDPVAIRDFAQAAESLGYHHLLTYDHDWFDRPLIQVSATYRDCLVDLVQQRMDNVKRFFQFIARRIRDLCLESGIRMNIEDTGGTTLQATAAVHLAQATPEPFRRATWMCVEHLTTDPIDGGSSNLGGWAVAPDGAGLGAVPDVHALGAPVATYELED